MVRSRAVTEDAEENKSGYEGNGVGNFYGERRQNEEITRDKINNPLTLSNVLPNRDITE